MDGIILKYKSGIISAGLANSEKILVKDLDFVLRKAETLALIGETGSGKTMTALSIMQLMPSNVKMSAGKVNFLGSELTQCNNMPKLLGNEIVYIPQNGLEFLNPSMKIRGHLYDSLKKLGASKAELEKTALEKLSDAGLENPEEVIDKYPFQLSGGMAQRVTIALSACSNAKLVIADEPTNGLDSASKKSFMQRIKQVFPDAAKLIITHDIGIAELCDRVLVLCGGYQMESGKVTEVLNNPRHPYTKALMGALVENGMQQTPTLRDGTGVCPFFARCPNADEKCAVSMEYHSDGDTEWWCSGE